MSNHVGTAERRREAWSGIAPGAEAVGGVQLLCALLYAQLNALAQEPYGRGFGGGIAVLFWLFVMVVGSPFVVILLGYVHSVLFTTPVMELSNAAGMRTRVSAPWWALPMTGALAVLYSIPVSLLAGPSYAATCGWIAAAGVLPVGVAVLARMRQVPRGKVRKWMILPGVAAVITTFYFGATAPVYEPPVLGRAEYVGEWSGDGVRLELTAQGEAAANWLPVDDGLDVVGHCTARGTWKPEEAAYGRGAGVALTVPDCKDAQLRWEVAGTAKRPELFVLIGDPDAGDMRVLRKR
ncbi:hypothetical protein J7F03_06925 [Streptomyces sp. ISL-43]|uniref:hypothetical protein n=1 Tax=Streptomyces sp. ISL-43 TaxID=2819183 RepID=UPI001BE9C2A9|nr:hypothetical protein [Streptomyces sp. ISL-43]MBT2446812.1 hypothetical protein [Streptomyces sp. ISL-43]